MANSHTYTFFRQLSTSSFSRPGFSSASPVQGNQRLSIRPVSTHAQPGMYSSLSGEPAQHGLQWMQTFNTQQGHAGFPKQDWKAQHAELSSLLPILPAAPAGSAGLAVFFLLPASTGGKP